VAAVGKSAKTLDAFDDACQASILPYEPRPGRNPLPSR